MGDKVVQDELDGAFGSNDKGITTVNVTQPNHGFTVSDYPLPAYIDKTTGKIELAQADNEETLKVFYITQVIDANTLAITAQFYEVSQGHNLSLYEYYFLSDVLAGGVALNPATFNDVVFYTFSPTQLILLDNRSIAITPPTGMGADADWYKQGTTEPPTDISEDIETGGDLKLTNYNHFRGDGDMENLLFTDAEGNVKASRVLPHLLLNEDDFTTLSQTKGATQNSIHRLVKKHSSLQANLTLFNYTRFNTNENFREYTVPISEPVEQVATLDGYIYLINQTATTVYMFNPNKRKVEQVVTTGFSGDFNRSTIYNPITNKLYSLNSAGTQLFIFDIESRLSSLYDIKSTINGGNSAYRYVYGGIPSLDYTFLYYIPYSGNQILKIDVLGIENNVVGNNDFTYPIPSAFSYRNNVRWGGGRIGRNGVIYGCPQSTNVWLRIDTVNGDAITTFPALANSTTFNRGMLGYTSIDPTGQYILSGWNQPANTLGLTNAQIRGVVQRINTDDDTIDYVSYPNGLNHVTSGYWGTVGGFCLGIDGLLYQAPFRNLAVNDWGYVLDPTTFSTIQEFDGASGFGYKTPVTAMNGKMYAFQQYAPYNKVLEIYPIGEIKHDPEKIVLISKAL